MLDAPVVQLTNVSLEHTDVLGATREAIAREKLAVVRPGATVVLGEPEWALLVPEGARVVAGRRRARPRRRSSGGASTARSRSSCPAGFEVHGDEVWDGAHNPAGVDWLVERLPRRDYVVVASILADKDARAMLERLAEVGRTFVAMQSSNPRALTPEELAALAEPLFERVRTGSDLGVALEEARREGPVLVTGSLYLLQDLAAARPPVRAVR